MRHPLVRLGMVLLLATPSVLPAQDAADAGAVITSKTAKEITRGFTHELDSVRSHVYSAAPFRELLAQPGTEGVRFFFARRDGLPTLVAMSTDRRGRRLPGGSTFVDDGRSCPPDCPGTLAPIQDVSLAGSVIDAESARSLTRGFTDSRDGVRSFLYSSELFHRLLAQDGAEGLRIHHAVRDGRPALVFSATDAHGDPLPQGLFVDDGAQCPPRCPGS